jgi:hypothetical protein
MKFLPALITIAIATIAVAFCAARLAHDEHFQRRIVYVPAQAQPACSRSATQQEVRECAYSKCYGVMLTTQALEDCVLQCRAAAAAYLRGCELSGGVLP